MDGDEVGDLRRPLRCEGIDMIGHPNLKAHWRLEGNSNDSSGSGFNGTDTSMVYGASSGIIGQGAALTSARYSSMGNVLGFESNQPHSIGAWLKGAQNLDSTIITKQQGGFPYWGYGLSTRASNAYQMFIYNGPTAVIVSFPSVETSGWHHIMYTYTGSRLASGVVIYIDGVVASPTVQLNNLNTSTITSTAAFQINGRGGANNMWTGDIDDVQVYNYVLPASDVRRIMFGKHPLTRS